MKQKTAIITVFALLLLVLPVFGNEKHENDKAYAQKEIKAKREAFYGDVENKLKFKKSEIDTVVAAGYSPFFSMMMLIIAKEGKASATEVIKMRADGKCWGEICKALGISYEDVVNKFEAAVIANNIKFPMSTGAEQEADIKYSNAGVK